MKPRTFRKWAAVASSLLLVGGLVANRAGVWELTAPTPLAISTKEGSSVRSSAETSPPIPSSTKDVTLMSGSKSGNGILLSLDITSITFPEYPVVQSPNVSLNDGLALSPAASKPVHAPLQLHQPPMMGGSKSGVGFTPFDRDAIAVDLPKTPDVIFNDIPSLSQSASKRVYSPLQLHQPPAMMGGSKSTRVFTPPAQTSLPSVNGSDITTE